MAANLAEAMTVHKTSKLSVILIDSASSCQIETNISLQGRAT